MSIKTELLDLLQRICRLLPVPAVHRVYIPEPRPHEARHTEFGLVELADGSAGLYYAWLGESQQGMTRRYAEPVLRDLTPLALAQYLQREDDAGRSLGMAAVNAVSQFLFRQAGYTPPAAGDSMGALDLDATDHLGMVGYFPSLVDRLRQAGIRTTVLEKKTRFQGAQGSVRVSLDPDDLNDCNKVLCTAATLLNDSMDEVLQHTGGADTVVVVGPTAGFLPDPLFRRGVDAVGGTRILDAGAAISALQQDAGLGGCAQRYLIRRRDYPGGDALLDKAAGGTG